MSPCLLNQAYMQQDVKHTCENKLVRVCWGENTFITTTKPQNKIHELMSRISSE